MQMRKRSPRQIEAAEQRTVMLYASNVRDLKDTIFHIPNGGARNATEAALLKAEGVRAGVSDLFIPLPIMRRPLEVGECHGLWLEMKKTGSTASSLSPKQREWRDRMHALGYVWEMAAGPNQAVDVLSAYMYRYWQAVASR